MNLHPPEELAAEQGMYPSSNLRYLKDSHISSEYVASWQGESKDYRGGDGCHELEAARREHTRGWRSCWAGAGSRDGVSGDRVNVARGRGVSQEKEGVS